MNTERQSRNQKTWRFFASSLVRAGPNPPRRREDAKNHEEFSISGKILSSQQSIFGLVVQMNTGAKSQHHSVDRVPLEVGVASLAALVNCRRTSSFGVRRLVAALDIGLGICPPFALLVAPPSIASLIP